MVNVPYANVVGSLMYFMLCTRPYIGYVVSIVSMYLSNPGKLHWESVKWILIYLSVTRQRGLVFGNCSSQDQIVQGYVDSYFAKDLDKGRSITSYVFTLFGGILSWKSTLQRVVA